MKGIFILETPGVWGGGGVGVNAEIYGAEIL